MERERFVLVSMNTQDHGNRISIELISVSADIQGCGIRHFSDWVLRVFQVNNSAQITGKLLSMAIN